MSIFNIFHKAEQIGLEAARTGIGIVNPNLVPAVTNVVQDLIDGGHLDGKHVEKLSAEIARTAKTIGPLVP